MHDERGMRLACRTKVGFDAEMDLHRAVFEPCAAALRQLGRLRHFRDAERARVELARDFFLAGRPRELYVIETGDTHGSPRRRRATRCEEERHDEERAEQQID